MAVRLLCVPSRSPIRSFIARCASGVLLSGLATGVGHVARATSLAKLETPFCELFIPRRSEQSGVGHVETIFTTPGKETVIFVPFSRLPVALAVPIPWPPSPSALVGVGHVVVNGCVWTAPANPAPFLGTPLFSASFVIGVGHVARATSLATDDEARLPEATFCNTFRLPVSFQSLACGVDQGDSCGTKS
jgi:hypothetical protein